TLKNLTPDMNGQIEVKMINTRDSRYVVINAMVIKAYDSYDNNGDKVIDSALYYRMMRNRAAALGNQGMKDSVNMQESSDLEANIFPNPFNDLINIRLNNPREGRVMLSLYDMSGRMVSRKFVKTNKGVNVLQFRPERNLEPGIYILSLENVGIVNKKITFKLI